jgi:heavy metal translocating P-type ATPase
MAKKMAECRVVHELPGRLRIRCPEFHDPSFDPAYTDAVLNNLPGVDRVRFNPGAGTVVVGYNGTHTCRRDILACLESLPAEACHPLPVRRPLPDPVGVAAKAVFSLLTPALPRRIRGIFSWAMGLPVMVRGMETLLSKGIKVEVLDAAAVGFSLARHQFFTANAIVALLALGEYLEQVSDVQTIGLLTSLLKPQVDRVRVQRGGAEIHLAPAELRVGDRVVCGSGEMVPVDGRIMEGEASLDQSSITGESMPVHVQPGDEILSGSLIHEGRIILDARQVGAETRLARLNRFLENSLRSKSPGQQQSERLADRLVPATLGMGLGMFLLTRDIRRAAAVLTVDFSCAIKLANPVATRTAIYSAAREGVLLKGSQALSALSRVDTVVFDKTGTLTRGALEVTDVVPEPGISRNDLLALAAAAETHYAHPVARAVVAEAGALGLALPPTGRVDFIVAHGVSAYVNGNRVLVGSRHFIEEDEGIDCSAVDRSAGTLRKNGKSLLYVARENHLLGVIALRDALRPEAARVLKDLKSAGIKKIITLTGDHPDTARAVAEKLPDLDEIFWDLKPEQKAAIVSDLQNQGHRVAFAGDGVNDAPALITADVGICMPGGADLARESAQVVLLREDLGGLVMARHRAVQAQNVIQTCFFTSVSLNALFLFLAGSGRIPPVLAAILHNTSTVGILGYSATAGTPPSETKKDMDP